MPATLRDIAEAVGTSITTVSKVLNGKDIRVSEAKRQEILAEAEKRRYIPTIAGVNLRKGCTDTVAVVIADLLYPYYAKLLKEINRLLQSQGKSVVVCDMDNNYEMECQHYQRLLTGYVDGAIVMPGPSTLVPEHVQATTALFERIDLPIVMIFGGDARLFPRCSKAGTDGFQMGYLAARHLIELGHRNIAYVSGLSSGDQTFNPNLAGFLAALEEAGLPAEKENILLGYTRYSGGRQAYAKVARTGATAVVCSSDMVAIGLAGAATDDGKAVPGDYSVVGMDDIMATQYSQPKITTVSQNVEEIAQRAVEHLFADLSARQAGRRAEVRRTLSSPVLVVRESTARAAL